MDYLEPLEFVKTENVGHRATLIGLGLFGIGVPFLDLLGLFDLLPGQLPVSPTTPVFLAVVFSAVWVGATYVAEGILMPHIDWTVSKGMIQLKIKTLLSSRIVCLSPEEVHSVSVRRHDGERYRHAYCVVVQTLDGRLLETISYGREAAARNLGHAIEQRLQARSAG